MRTRAPDRRTDDPRQEPACRPARVEEGGDERRSAVGLRAAEQEPGQAEHDRLVAELAAERARLRAILEQMPAAVVVAEAPSGRIVLANRNFGDVFAPPAPFPADVQELFAAWRARRPDGSPVEDRDRPLARALRGEAVGGELYRMQQLDGTERWVHFRAVPLLDDAGVVTGAVTVAADVDRERRAEAEREEALRALAESEERYRLAAIASEDAIYDWDVREDRVTRLSLPGHVRGAVTDMASWSALIHPDDRERFLTGVRAATQDCGRRWASEYRMQAKQGGWSVVLDRGYVVCDEHGHPARMVGVVRDVTARRRQEEFERQLIGIVSHDLRTPLNTIALAAGMMARAGADERTVKGAARILGAVDRADRMIRDLLDFTRARVGAGIPIQRCPVDLGRVMAAIVDELRAGAPQRSISFRQTGDATGVFDADRLAQVLTNLLDNALKYSPPGSPVRVELAGETDEVLLSVHNRGPAIAPALLPRIFEPLQRGESCDAGGRSIGLGLYIVKSLVEAHGGRVEICSSDEAGTQITAHLPRT